MQVGNNIQKISSNLYKIPVFKNNMRASLLVTRKEFTGQCKTRVVAWFEMPHAEGQLSL